MEAVLSAPAVSKTAEDLGAFDRRRFLFCGPLVFRFEMWYNKAKIQEK